MYQDWGDERALARDLEQVIERLADSWADPATQTSAIASMQAVAIHAMEWRFGDHGRATFIRMADEWYDRRQEGK